MFMCKSKYSIAYKEKKFERQNLICQCQWCETGKIFLVFLKPITAFWRYN